MKQIKTFFSVAITAIFCCIIVSCSSDDENLPNVSSKRISMISMDIEKNGNTKNSFLQLSYNQKKQITDIYCNSSGKMWEYFIDYQTKEITSPKVYYRHYYNLNNQGYVSDLKYLRISDSGTEEDIRRVHFDYDNNGYMISAKTFQMEYLMSGQRQEVPTREVEYTYSNGNLIKVNTYVYYNKSEKSPMEGENLIFTYSEDLNVLGLPSCFAIYFAYWGYDFRFFPYLIEEGYPHINMKTGLVSTGVALTGLFGKPSKNLILSCREETFGYVCRFRYKYDDNGNLKEIKGNSTLENYTWYIEY